MSGDSILKMILLGEDRSASKTVHGVGDAADKTSGRLKSLGKIAGGVFAGGALFEGAEKGVDFLKDSVKAAMDDEQANAILARQMKNTTGANKEQIAATEEWIKKQAEATGVSRDQLIPQLTKLDTATHNASKGQKLLTLAQNVSAGTGKGLSSIVDSLVRAQNGQTAGLSRLGIQTKDSHGKLLSFSQLQGTLAKQFRGDAASAADTAAGRMRRLGVTWEDMKVSLGEHLLPVLTVVLGFLLTKVIPAVGQLTSWLGDKLGPIITRVSGIFSNQTGSMSKSTGRDLGAIKDIFVTVVDIVRTLWRTFGKFLVTYVVATLKNLFQIIGGALKIIEGLFKVFDSLLHGDWKGVWQGIKLILAGALQIITGLLKQSLNLLKLLWKVGWTVLKAILGQVWDGIKALARLEIQGLIALVKGIPGAITKVGPLFLSAGKSLIGKLFDGIVAAARGGAGFVTNLVSAIKNSINSALHLPLSVNFDKGPLHIHATVIPALAKGGIVNRPTLALIGEAGPEAVLPLSGARGLGGGGGDIYVTVNTNGLVDKSSLMRDLHTALKDYRRGPLAGAALGLS